MRLVRFLSNNFSSAHDAKTNASRVMNGLEIYRTKPDTTPAFQRCHDFSPVSTLAVGGFMSEMHEATPVSQPFPHFERFLNSREAAALLQIHPKTFNDSPARARYALCGSGNCGASAHPISTRGYICG